jgi:hypothetical protein
VDERDYEHVVRFPEHVWQHAGCLAASSASAIEHGVSDMPHAMLLVRTFVLPRALYACQFWGPDMLQLSPCGQSSLQSKLLSICKHVLGLRGFVAQASLLDKLGLQPLQIIWLKAFVKFFATACTASRGNPFLREAMRAKVELSKAKVELSIVARLGVHD